MKSSKLNYIWLINFQQNEFQIVETTSLKFYLTLNYNNHY